MYVRVINAPADKFDRIKEIIGKRKLSFAVNSKAFDIEKLTPEEAKNLVKEIREEGIFAEDRKWSMYANWSYVMMSNMPPNVTLYELFDILGSSLGIAIFGMKQVGSNIGLTFSSQEDAADAIRVSDGIIFKEHKIMAEILPES